MEEENINSPKPQIPTPILKCNKCDNPITENYYFCPICGVKIKEPPFQLSWSKIIGYILLAILFPPLGIFPGIRHLRIKDNRARLLGIIYIVLTIIATFFVLKITLDFINNMNQMISGINQTQSYY